MCVAIYKPETAKFPTRAVLKNCWENNPDGAGIAALVPPTKKGQDATVKIIKGFMSFKSLYKTLRSGMFDDLETVVHFRWATSGYVNEGMTHPFPVGTIDNKDLLSLEIEAEKAVIHNGVMFNPKIGEYSDTAIFAKWLSIAKPSNNKIRKVLGNDRLAIVCKYSGVKLMGTWYKLGGDQGCYFSNLYSHEPKFSWKSGNTGTTYLTGRMGNSFGVDWDDDKLWNRHYYSGSSKSTTDNHDNAFAYHDSRHEIDDKPSSLPEDDMGTCPICKSDNVYLIGLKTNTVECQDCGIVYNSVEWLEPTGDLYDY